MDISLTSMVYIEQDKICPEWQEGHMYSCHANGKDGSN